MDFSIGSVGRSLIASTLGRTNLPHIYHRKVVPGHFTILMYHGVVAEPLKVNHFCFINRTDFKDQIEYLVRNFRVLSLEDAVQRSEEGKIDGPTIVLTFDDGFQNNFDVAFPILENFAAPATIFLTTDFIGTDRTLWYCRLHHALQTTNRTSLQWNGNTLSLATTGERARASKLLLGELKRCSPSRLLEELECILTSLGVGPEVSVPPNSPFRVLDRESIEVMSRSGLIDFGAHTESHVILSRAARSVKREEIENSIDRVTEVTGRRCRTFAYPNGQEGDYDRESIAILGSAGVRTAVTTIPGGNTKKTPRLELRRYGVGPETDLRAFQLTVHHVLAHLKSAMRVGTGR